jgi:hypothetical protein
VGHPLDGVWAVMTGIDIGRIANSKLVECWTKSDDLGLLQQIGDIPAPTQTA